MARIRTIKPEFWNDEEIGELSSNARLMFIASWNLADDEGLLKWSPAFLKAQVFAYDDLTKSDVECFMSELSDSGFIHPYNDAKGKSYGWIVNFRTHQKIDRPQAPKHPLPSLQNPKVRQRIAERDGWRCHICEGEIDPATNANKMRLSLDHVSPKSKGGIDAPSNIKASHFGCNSSKRDKSPNEEDEIIRRTFGERSPPEGNREQGTGKGTGKGESSDDDSSPEGDASGGDEPDDSVPTDAAPPPCPAQDIVAIYHETLPELPRVARITDARREKLQARWREAESQRSLDWWRWYFQKVRQSPFLMGHGPRGWKADLEWLTKLSNFTKVLEDQYAKRSAPAGAGEAGRSHSGFEDREYTSHIPDWAQEYATDGMS